MLNPSPQLAALEEAFAREVYDRRTYAEALARYSALWAEARALRPDVGDDWMDDLAADLAVARALNGLPPHA